MKKMMMERLGLAVAIAGLVLLSAAFVVGLGAPEGGADGAAPLVVAAR
jgi:hypothetical protein